MEREVDIGVYVYATVQISCSSFSSPSTSSSYHHDDYYYYTTIIPTIGVSPSSSGFDLATAFGERAPVRITTMVDEDMIQTRLKQVSSSTSIVIVVTAVV